MPETRPYPVANCHFLNDFANFGCELVSCISNNGLKRRSLDLNHFELCKDIDGHPGGDEFLKNILY
jgi:hypothetical protein